MAPHLDQQLRERIVSWRFDDEKPAREIAALANFSEATVYNVLRLQCSHVRRTCYQLGTRFAEPVRRTSFPVDNMFSEHANIVDEGHYKLRTRFAEPVRRTSPANHPPIWSKWSEWSMPPGVTRSECIPSLRCLLFCPEKNSTLIYRCRPTMQTLLECFVRINLYFSTLINAYNKTVSTLC